MQKAETVLGIIYERGKRGLPLENLYRMLYNPELYLRAYAKLYPNKGAMTPGVTTETADGMSRHKIDEIINALRFERYRWTPARRIYIEKPNSTKLRPLGIPSWSDKLLQEVIRSILEAYYEPQFSDHSHGFRPNRGCHTALSEIYHGWIATTWFIEGDISACFDSLDHQVMMSILRQKIHDQRFLRLMETLLKAGYLEQWRYNNSLSGVPQGSVLGPLLANIYLSQLDGFVETQLLPQYNEGKTRGVNLEYARVMEQSKRLKKKGDRKQARAVRRQAQQLPSLDTRNPKYRRLRYTRYADDILFGFVGPHDQAEEIKQKLGEFLQTIKLNLSETKTLLTHARTQAAHFLGYEIVVLNSNQKHDWRGHRSINGQIGLKVPRKVIQAKYHTYMSYGKPKARAELCHNSVYTIVAQYQQEFRGIVEYYRMAYNVGQFNTLKWIMERSLLSTLSNKLRMSINRVRKSYTRVIQTEQGAKKVLQVKVERGEGKSPLIAEWGGISLARKVKAVLEDQPYQIHNRRTELLERFLADKCELCGSQMNVEVHHIRALKDLQRPGRREKPEWVKVMAARHRKTLVVCRKCHDEIHAGRISGHIVAVKDTGEPR